MYVPLNVWMCVHTRVVVSVVPLSVEAHWYCPIDVLTLVGVASVGGERNNPVQTHGEKSYLQKFCKGVVSVGVSTNLSCLLVLVM